MNVHKALSDIETDIRQYYDGAKDLDDAVLSVIGRALALLRITNAWFTDFDDAGRTAITRVSAEFWRASLSRENKDQ